MIASSLHQSLPSQIFPKPSTILLSSVHEPYSLQYLSGNHVSRISVLSAKAGGGRSEEEEEVKDACHSRQDVGMGVKHPFQDHHIRVQTRYRGACSEHQYPELLHKKPRRRNQIEGSPPYLRWCWGVDTESQFLPDGIFKHRRRPYAKMGHLKRKADTSTHIPPPLGPPLLFRYLGQIQKGYPIYEPTYPLRCSPRSLRKHAANWAPPPATLQCQIQNSSQEACLLPAQELQLRRDLHHPLPVPCPSATSTPLQAGMLLLPSRAHEAAAEEQLFSPDARETLTRYYSNPQL